MSVRIVIFYTYASAVIIKAACRARVSFCRSHISNVSFYKNLILHGFVKKNSQPNFFFHTVKSHPSVQAVSLEEFDMDVKIEIKEEKDETSEKV